MEKTGLEPVTSRLQGGRTTNCATSPRNHASTRDRPEMANHSMRESNPHCSHAGSQFCVSFLHDSGSGGNRTPGVSNVTGLQTAAFAARHTLPRKLGWLFKESNLVLFSKRSAIKLQPLTMLIRSPAPVRPQVLTATPMWKKTHAADEFLPVHPVGMARLELADLSLPKRALYHLSYIPKIDVQA